MSDQLLLIAQLHIRQKFLKISDGHGSNFMNIFVSHCHRQRRCFQALSFTGFAGRNSHKALKFRFAVFGKSFPVTTLHIFNQPFKGYIIKPLSALSFIMNLHFFSIGAMKQNILHFFRIILERGVQIKIILFRQCL